MVGTTKQLLLMRQVLLGGGMFYREILALPYMALERVVQWPTSNAHLLLMARLAAAITAAEAHFLLVSSGVCANL